MFKTNPIPLQFAKTVKDNIAINPFCITPPTIRVTGMDTQFRCTQAPRLVECGATILAAMATPEDCCADLCMAVKSGGKRGSRKNRKKLNKHTVTNTNRVRARKPVGKSKKKSTTATASGKVKKSCVGSGTKSHSKKVHKSKKWRKRNEREATERKKWLENWIDSENKRKGEEAVNGLVGLMEGFGIGIGDKVQEEWMVEGRQEGMDMDMVGFEVMREDEDEDLCKSKAG
ncbi:hypothetical protein C7212DRAFT_348582 [Tuber magnatum]|uniref:Uncharacterized protein n=1 Tax=Tuber magnatum TaxID=42249 RepID=A0A317SB86_9PEZI|nr:hypothetical protein C7212DRAFT_348582 [Tuber magnatum]